MALDHLTLTTYRDRHPAWRLLASPHAPLVASFLYRVFVAPNVRVTSEADLAEMLEDELFALREQLGLADSAADSPNTRSNVVVAQIGGQRAGIVVDALLGEYQTVIKPLGALFAHLQGISGSTILGNGEVALILDAAPLISRASRSAQGRQAPALSN